ncbi:MAG: SRPBCC family protein [Nitrosopumilaceae archaeon]|nr:SRPBCC family protein [Nitrosopumilaceae archaeon]
MTIIQSSIRINASIDKVWNVVSDLDNEPKFWKGTKEIKNISREENKITREITIAFKDSKCMQEVTLEPKQKIQATFTKGIIDGTKTIELIPIEDTTEVEVTWDIKLSGLIGMFTGMVKKHIKNGTDQALKSIKQEVER